MFANAKFVFSMIYILHFLCEYFIFLLKYFPKETWNLKNDRNIDEEKF